MAAIDPSQRRTFLKPGELNREKTCPLLLKVFHRIHGHHRAEDFDSRRIQTLSPDEAQIYTWKDATLREITELIKAINPAAKSRNARISYAFAYPDKVGRMVMRQVGECWGDERNGYGKDDNKTLDELHFETGDYLDAAIHVK